MHHCFQTNLVIYLNHPRYIIKKRTSRGSRRTTSSQSLNSWIAILLIHQPVFQKELNHLIKEKVLQRIETSEWAFPTFLIPKNDGRVWWISDFCRLNKLLTRPRYFLPSIPAIMQKRAGFSSITKIDLSMGFYTFELDANARKLCVISTPF